MAAALLFKKKSCFLFSFCPCQLIIMAAACLDFLSCSLSFIHFLFSRYRCLVPRLTLLLRLHQCYCNLFAIYYFSQLFYALQRLILSAAPRTERALEDEAVIYYLESVKLKTSAVSKRCWQDIATM